METVRHHASSKVFLFTIWINWVIVVLLLALMNQSTHPPHVAADVLVILHAGVGVFVVSRMYHKPLAAILGLSLVLRTGMVFWDLYFTDVWILPSSGSDSEMYYFWASEVARKPGLIYEDIRGGVFSKLFGLLFWLVGPLRVLGQYTTALLGMSVVFLLDRVCDELPLTETQRIRALTIAALLPNTLVLSAIFLRESVIAFLIAVSVYAFVRWFNGGSALHILTVAAAVVAAATFHAGVIAVGVGYMVVAITYRRKEGRFGINFGSFVYIAFFIIVVFFVVAKYPDLFLGSFEEFETEDDLLRATNYREGGSKYLTELTVSSYADLIRVGPLRAIYFLSSPMPWDFRRLMDIVTFFTDSIFYLGVPLIVLLRLRRLDPRTRALGVALLLTIAVASLVFGAGVSNAGTAARHRFKLVSVVMALMAIAFTTAKRSAAARRDNALKATGRGGPPDEREQQPRKTIAVRGTVGINRSNVEELRHG